MMLRLHKKPPMVAHVAVLVVMASAVACGLWQPAEPPAAAHGLATTPSGQAQPASGLQAPGAAAAVDPPAAEVAGRVERVHDVVGSGLDARDPLGAAQAERARSRGVAMREAAFRAEDMDLDWAASARAQLQQVFTSEPAGHVQLRSIECRASSCRLELADDGAVPLEGTLAELAHRIPPPGWTPSCPGR
jgi:hypothetical protein